MSSRMNIPLLQPCCHLRSQPPSIKPNPASETESRASGTQIPYLHGAKDGRGAVLATVDRRGASARGHGRPGHWQGAQHHQTERHGSVVKPTLSQSVDLYKFQFSQINAVVPRNDCWGTHTQAAIGFITGRGGSGTADAPKVRRIRAGTFGVAAVCLHAS